MALDLSKYTNISDPRRRTAQTFNLGNLWVDQEGGYSRDADGQRYWDPEGTAVQSSYYMGGAPGAGTKLMRLDEVESQVPGATEAYRRIAGDKILNLNGMEFLTEQDASPILQAMKGASTTGTLVGDNLYKVLMAAVGGMGAGGIGSTGEFAGMGTFGGGSGFVGGASGAGVSGATGGGELALGSGGSSAVGGGTAALGGAGAAGGASYGFGSLPDTTQWLNPTELTGQAGGLPTANAGQFGSVVDLANSGLNLPVNSGVTGGSAAPWYQSILDAYKSIPGLPGNGSGGNLTQPTGDTTFGIPNNILAGILQGGAGWLGADKQSDAFRDVNAQWLAMGQPSRDRFNSSFGSGFDLLQADPGLQLGMDTAADTVARRLSIGGNPASNPGMQAEIQKYLLGNVYLPQLNTYRSQNLTGGQLGTNTAGTAALGGAGIADNGIAALAGGVGRLFGESNTPSFEEMMRRSGGTNPFTLNTGQPRNGILGLV
jgi:hypothetical protein